MTSEIIETLFEKRLLRAAQIAEWENWHDDDRLYALRRVGNPASSPVFSVLSRPLGSQQSYVPLLTATSAALSARIAQGRPYLPYLLAACGGPNLSHGPAITQEIVPIPVESIVFDGGSLSLFTVVGLDGTISKDYEIVLRVSNDPDYEMCVEVKAGDLAITIGAGRSALSAALATHPDVVRAIGVQNPKIYSLIEKAEIIDECAAPSPVDPMRRRKRI